MSQFLSFSSLRALPRQLRWSRSIGTKRYNIVTEKEIANLIPIRHSAAHVMAMAVQSLYPDGKVTIGPWIQHGFYYDFFFPERKFSDGDLKAIKKEMDKIIRAKLPIRREEVSREEARRRILEQDEPYKLELLDSIQTEPITIYHIGDRWWDLCAGPHVESTGHLNPAAISLQSVAGAYWKGDEKNVMLQRIYGTAWESPSQLSLYQEFLEEAKARDHRTIGKNLDLFSIQESAGGGLVFWHSKGAIMRRIIEDYWKDEHLANGYELLSTPHLADLDLWKTSGHHDFYRQDMFAPIEVEDKLFQLKPMNCPFHCLVYKNSPKSYKDLPIRWAEMGTVYRYERSGTLHGLMRVRGFTQDDAHIFCLASQLEDEIVGVLQLTEGILKKFHFVDYHVMLSTRPAQSVGTDEIWNQATNSLINALSRKGWSYEVDEGGGAFYGPKIDIKVQDALGRLWQCSTIQCDFNLPERFELEYGASDQSRQRPIMVHRAIFGSLERFFGVLIENTAGDFPLWLAPIHLRLLPVTDNVRDYCLEIQRLSRHYGLRVEVDSSGQRISKQIRKGEVDRLPLVAVIGQEEKEKRTMSLRVRGRGEIGSYEVGEVLGGVQEMIVRNVMGPEEIFFGKRPVEGGVEDERGEGRGRN